jgi:hypothetical protein
MPRCLVYALVFVYALVLGVCPGAWCMPWCLVYALVFVYALVLGVYGSAAVPRGGLGPPTPPLCRYAVHTKHQGSE